MNDLFLVNYCTLFGKHKDTVVSGMPVDDTQRDKQASSTKTIMLSCTYTTEAVIYYNYIGDTTPNPKP